MTQQFRIELIVEIERQPQLVLAKHEPPRRTPAISPGTEAHPARTTGVLPGPAGQQYGESTEPEPAQRGGTAHAGYAARCRAAPKSNGPNTAVRASPISAQEPGQRGSLNLGVERMHSARRYPCAGRPMHQNQMRSVGRHRQVIDSYRRCVRAGVLGDRHDMGSSPRTRVTLSLRIRRGGNDS